MNLLFSHFADKVLQKAKCLQSIVLNISSTYTGLGGSLALAQNRVWYAIGTISLLKEWMNKFKTFLNVLITSRLMLTWLWITQVITTSAYMTPQIFSTRWDMPQGRLIKYPGEHLLADVTFSFSDEDSLSLQYSTRQSRSLMDIS